MTRGFLRSLGRQAPKARAQWLGSGGVGFRAAEQNRLLKDWVWRNISADQEILYDLVALRGRSRELVRNSAWGANYVRVIRNNVIGPNGIGLQMQVKKPDGTPNAEVNGTIESAFKAWGRRGVCTVDRKHSWRGVQSLLAKGLAMDGEVLVRLVRGWSGNEFGFALQFIDPDQLDQWLTIPPQDGRNEIRGGVEIDQWGAPVAYHIWRGHPSDPTTASRGRERVPAADVIHLLDPYRVAQTRGVPWLAPVMIDVNHLRGYHEAELVAARVAAAKGGFFERAAGDDGPGIAEGEEGDDALSLEAEPGVFEELPAGLTFKEWNPQHPSAAFGDFNRAKLRTIAAGGGVSATSLSKDLSDVNYSSIRAGLLDERDDARRVQWLFIEGFHDPVFAEFCKMARLYGQLDGRYTNRAVVAAASWRPRGWPWVDPRADAEAAQLRIGMGLDSRTRLVSEEGRDFEEVLDEIAEETKLAAKLGVSIVSEKPAAKADTATEKRDGGQGDAEDDDELDDEVGANGNGNGTNGNGRVTSSARRF